MPGSMAAENEFGDLPWCKACAEHGVKLIEMSVEAGEISLDGIEWAFSEEYTEACPRVLGGRKVAVYWFAVSGGKIHAGWDDLPDWVLVRKYKLSAVMSRSFSERLLVTAGAAAWVSHRGFLGAAGGSVWCHLRHGRLQPAELPLGHPWQAAGGRNFTSNR